MVMNFLMRYKRYGAPLRASHSRMEGLDSKVTFSGVRSRMQWGIFNFAREPDAESRGGRQGSWQGFNYESTRTCRRNGDLLWWGSFDNELYYVEAGGQSVSAPMRRWEAQSL